MMIAMLFFLPFLTLQANCKHTKTSLNCVQYVKNYDGDTVTFNIPDIHPLLGHKISIRVNGLDTPELRTKNKCEKQKALIAKAVVTKALSQAKRIDLRNVQRGKYFRIVADVYADNKSVKDLLLKKRLAYKYHGKTKQKINWCNP